MVRIQIHLPSPLQRYTRDLSHLEVEASTVGGALTALFDELPELSPRILDANGHVFPYLYLLLSGRELDRQAFAEEALSEGDDIDIVPGIEGGSGGDDVRMKGFRRRHPVMEARLYLASLKTAIELIPGRTGAEFVALNVLAGRVLSVDIHAAVDVPSFDRSAMDGYAIHGEESFSASPYNPITLDLCGESMPGMGGDVLPQVGPGQACRIMTGARIPPGADAVVKFEDSRLIDEDAASTTVAKIEILTAVTPGKNIGRRGEDVAVGDCILAKGRRLRPQDIGILASVGRDGAVVRKKPRVAILVTGSELLAVGSQPRDGAIVDSNTPMLEALVHRDGAELVGCFHLVDNQDMIRDFLVKIDADVLICAGGSSVGREDFLPLLVQELGELPIHGIAMRPSAPTGLGRIGDMPVFLLPGNPVSCLCAYDFFASPFLRVLGGDSAFKAWGYGSIQVKTALPIHSALGRTDYVRVEFVAGDAAAGCVPIALSGASILSSTTRAAGFVVVDEDSEGFDVGQDVQVYLYDSGSN